MTTLGAALVAFLIASSIAWLELITSNYPRTYFLIKKCIWLYLYCAAYGLISAGVALFLPFLVDSQQVSGLTFRNPWILAIAVGLVAKAFMHIRFFSVSVGPQSFPVGVETLVQLFEPWFLNNLKLEHFNNVRGFIGPVAKKYPDLSAVKESAKRELPPTFTPEQKAAFKADVDRAESVSEVMNLYLSFMGRKSFTVTFP